MWTNHFSFSWTTVCTRLHVLRVLANAFGCQQIPSFLFQFRSLHGIFLNKVLDSPDEITLEFNWIPCISLQGLIPAYLLTKIFWLTYTDFRLVVRKRSVKRSVCMRFACSIQIFASLFLLPFAFYLYQIFRIKQNWNEIAVFFALFISLTFRFASYLPVLLTSKIKFTVFASLSI